METIPTVDLQPADLEGLSSEQRVQTVGKRIFQALKKIGFVYLLNHGLPESVCESAFQTAREFFALPLETKMKIRHFAHSSHNGYTPLGEEELSLYSEGAPGPVYELKELWDTQVTDRDMPTDDAPAFCRDMIALGEAFDKLCLQVLAGLETAMGRPGVLTSVHQHQRSRGTADLRCAHYPPLQEPVPVGAVRCATHADFDTITMLLQDDCGGLEVLGRSGWVPATPVPGAVLLNVGELMEFWTGGEIVATKHRVLVPEEERLRRSGRISIIFFSFPDYDTMVQPPTGPAISAGKYLSGKYQKTMPSFKDWKEEGVEQSTARLM